MDDGARVGKGTKIWHFCHISSDVEIGENSSLGQNCFVAPGVRIGSNVKIQNNVSIYGGTVIEDDVFLGPSCVLTNVSNPRSQVSRRMVYEPTLIRRGATVGANATIVCGVELGRYTFVAAGAVVTRTTGDYALVRGVPAKQRGWMSRHGHALDFSDEGVGICRESGLKYQLNDAGLVRCLDIEEEQSLPDHLSVGQQAYSEYRSEPTKSRE